MAATNFAALTTEEKTAWAMDFWEQERNQSFLTRFLGSDANSMVQRVTELKASEKGARAVITLIPDLTGDGIAGDRTLRGNEEAMSSDDQVIQIDQLRHANINEGRIAEQKSIVTFREQSRDKLAYWMADRTDQMAFLTLSGVAYTFTNAGATRTGSDLPYLSFASDVTAPSTNRYLVWDSTGFGVNSANTDLVAADTPTYRMLLEMKAYCQTNYIRPIRMKNGVEFYQVFMTPNGLMKLKQDADYLANVRNAGVRGDTNELFAGTDTVMIEGMAITAHRHVFHSATWGAGAVAGQRVLMCGAQALGYADIGNAYWNEEEEDYGNQLGISVGKIFGFKKPVFYSNHHASDEDFGVLCVDTAA